jgi:F0F1-type ATP synthase membrane subunit b/b'
MDQQTLLYIMTAFVVIAGIALLLQFFMLFGIYRTAKASQQKIEELLPKVHTLLETSQRALEQGKQQVLDITSKTNDILESTKRQLAKLEDLVGDASGRAKVQLERAEMVLDDTMSRAHETVALVHKGIMRPLREAQGIAAGVRTAVGHLTRGVRPSPAQATHDEEMFI